MFIVIVAMNMACKNAPKTTVETIEGITIKTFYTLEGNVELVLVTQGDSSFVAKPAGEISKMEYDQMGLSCANGCLQGDGLININCWKKCNKPKKFQIAVFGIAE